MSLRGLPWPMVNRRDLPPSVQDNGRGYSEGTGPRAMRRPGRPYCVPRTRPRSHNAAAGRLVLCSPIGPHQPLVASFSALPDPRPLGPPTLQVLVSLHTAILTAARAQKQPGVEIWRTNLPGTPKHTTHTHIYMHTHTHTHTRIHTRTHTHTRTHATRVSPCNHTTSFPNPMWEGDGPGCPTLPLAHPGQHSGDPVDSPDFFCAWA